MSVMGQRWRKTVKVKIHYHADIAMSPVLSIVLHKQNFTYSRKRHCTLKKVSNFPVPQLGIIPCQGEFGQ
jgi:hypothetical protein